MTPISVQLYSLREEMTADVVGALKKAAQMGYKGVEPAGLFDFSPAKFRKVVEDLGMTVSSSHGPGVTEENFDQAVETLKTLGLDCASHMGLGVSTGLDEVKATAETTNAIIEKLQAVGMTMFMHNHDPEFSTKFDGRPAFDIFFELCPKLQSEMDIYWVQVGGADPVDVVKRYAKRLPLMHVKDGPIDPPSPQSAVGQGKVDVAGCVKAADPDTLRWLIVELDEAPGDMVQALTESYDYLIGNGLAEGNR